MDEPRCFMCVDAEEQCAACATGDASLRPSAAPTVDFKDRPGPFDGLEGAAPDEPIFTLQGGDPSAPKLVLRWAEMARARALAVGAHTSEGQELLLRATNAEQVAWTMDAYRKGHAADAAKEVPHSTAYSTIGHEDLNLDATEKLRIHRLKTRAVERVSNAIADLSEQAKVLEDVGAPMMAQVLYEAVETLRDAEQNILPKRGERA